MDNWTTRSLRSDKLYSRWNLSCAKIDSANDQYIDGRIQLALTEDKRGRLKQRIDELKAEIDRSSQERRDAEAEAQIKGARVETGRPGDEILNEIRKASGVLVGTAHVPEDADEDARFLTAKPSRTSSKKWIMLRESTSASTLLNRSRPPGAVDGS